MESTKSSAHLSNFAKLRFLALSDPKAEQILRLIRRLPPGMRYLILENIKEKENESIRVNAKQGIELLKSVFFPQQLDAFSTMRLRNVSVCIATGKKYFNSVNAILRNLALLSALLGAAGVISILYFRIPNVRGTWNAAAIFTASLMGFAVVEFFASASALIWVPSKDQNNWLAFLFLWRMFFLFGYAYGAWHLYQIALHRPLMNSLAIIFFSFSASVASLLLLLGEGIISSLAVSLQKRRFYCRYPEAYLTSALMKCYESTATARDWSNLVKRQSMIKEMESASICVEHFLYAKLTIGQDAVDLWWKREMKRRAAGIREMKKWCLLPKSDTRVMLRDRLRHLLYCVLAGDWDALPAADVDETAGRKLLGRLQSLLNGSLLAVLPAAVFWLVQKTPAAISAPYSEYIKILLIIWATINILNGLDPSFNLKIDLLRNLAQIVMPGRKSDR